MDGFSVKDNDKTAIKMLEFKYHTYQQKELTEVEGNTVFNSVFEMVSDALFILDNNDLSIIDCNEAAVKLFEARVKSQLLGLPSFRLYNYEPSQLTSDSLESEIKINGEYTQEIAFRTLRQNVFWGRLTKKQVKDGNGVYLILKVTKAANYLKDEEALSTLLNGTAKVTGGMFFKELTRLLSRTFNAKYSFVAKYNHNSNDVMEIISLWSEQELNYNSITVKHSLIENVVRGYTSFYPSHLKEMFPADTFVSELDIDSFLGAPIFDSSGRSIGVIGIMNNKPMEEIPNSRYLLSIFASRSAAELQRMKSKDLLRDQTRELAFANHLKDRLLSVLSNDLKAPLHTILSYSDIIGERMHNYSTRQLSDKFEILDNSIRSLYSILENITDWSKLQNDEIIIRPEKVSLHSIVDANYSILQPLAQIKDLCINNEIPEELFVWADAHMMDSIVRNLLTVAVKYSDKGGDISFSMNEVEGKIVIAFKDSCSHIDEEEINQYWNISETLPEFLSSEQNQHALSLYLIREFINRMGSRISYEYQKDKGYTFFFDLKKCDIK
ncbi:MAG: PAS domain-containing sensor histidine kinase [Bacteroidales bacterium]|nr:PAS domain-containing sensor histidine kinase [Bacteroidales bacterium]